MATSHFEASPSSRTRCSPISTRSSCDPRRAPRRRRHSGLVETAVALLLVACAAGCEPDNAPIARGNKPTTTTRNSDETTPAADALAIDVIGKRFSWTFVYPDGRRTTELVVPTGRPLELTLRSEDVLHRFALPELGVAEDVVPGTARTLSVTLDEPGRHTIACAEYCGEDHKSMRSALVAESPEAFETWMTATAPAAADQRPAHADRGQVIFQLNGCTHCHRDPARAPALEGRFDTEVELADGTTVTFDAAYVRQSLLDPGARTAAGDWPEPMPSYAGKLGKREVDWLIDFIAAP